jgi:hypothetical protein
MPHWPRTPPRRGNRSGLEDEAQQSLTSRPSRGGECRQRHIEPPVAYRTQGIATSFIGAIPDRRARTDLRR